MTRQISRARGRQVPRRFTAATAGLLLALALCPLAATPAVADYAVPVAQGPRPTTVLAASGDSWVVSDLDPATGTGATTWYTDSGADTVPIDFSPAVPADYVRDGIAVWVGDGDQPKVRIVGLATGTSQETASLPDRPLAVSSGHALLGAGTYRLLDFTTPSDTPVRLTLDSDIAAPAAARYPRYDWVLEATGYLRLTRYYAVQGAGYPSYADIDPGQLDGGVGPAPFRVTGWVPYAGITAGGTGAPLVEYLVQAGGALKYCTATWAAQPGSPQSSCRKLLSVTGSAADAAISADRYGDALGITVKGVPYLYDAGALVRVKPAVGQSTFAGLGDPARPLLRTAGATGGQTYQVAATGVVTPVFDDAIGPVAPTALDLSATTLAGLDGRGLQQAWLRDAGATDLGAEVLLDGATAGIQVSAGRMAVASATGLRLHDRGDVVGAYPAVDELLDASGPYTLVRKGSKTSVLTPSGTLYGTRVAAIFGSRAVEFNATGTGGTVVDLAGQARTVNVPPSATGWTYDRALLWGDHLVLGSSYGTVQRTEAFNLESIDSPPTVAEFAVPLAIGDGVAALYDVETGDYRLWHLGEGFSAAAPGSAALADADLDVNPAIDGDSTLVYSTRTHLVVVDLTDHDGSDRLLDDSPARLLGAVAAPGLELNAPPADKPWSLDLDLTKPVDAGQLLISDATGVVRTIPVPASADGSLRDIEWDATTDADTDTTDVVAPDGTYTWRYVANSADDSGPVAGVDGQAAPTGIIVLSTAAIKAGTQTVTGAAAVGSTLAVAGSWTPPGLAMAYSWRRSGDTVPVATTPTYTPSVADLGRTFTVTVTGTNRRGTAVSKTSAATKKVVAGTLSPAPTPVLPAGVPVVGVALTATSAAWGPAPVDLAWSWSVVKKGKAKEVGTGDTYTPSTADVGGTLKVSVTGTKPGYGTLTKTSAASPKVVAAG
jgi:hypothetical protein